MEQDQFADFAFDDGFVLVVGSAGVDIKAHLHAPHVLGTIQHGHVRNSLGGVARNIAENLARLEVPTYLLTAVGDDEEGQRVITVTEEANVHCDFVREVAGARTGSTVTVLQADNTPHLILSDYAIAEHVNSDYLQQHELMFSLATMVVIDGTLSEEALETLFELAAQYNLRVCADPTTPAYAAKLRPYISQMYLVVPNATETDALCGVPVHIDTDAERPEADAAARELVRLGAEIGVVTLGAHGMVYAHRNGGGFIRAAQVEVVDTTGAGDAFSAAAIFGLLHEVSLDEAMRLGNTAAALTLSTRETVYPHLNQEELYATLAV